MAHRAGARIHRRSGPPDAAHSQGEAADELASGMGRCSNRGVDLLHARPKKGQKRPMQGGGPFVSRPDQGGPVESSSLSLDDLPILKCWPQDGGRDSSLCRTFTPAIPDTGERNLGMYRMQVYDGQHDRDALAGAQGRRASRAALLRARRAHAGRRVSGRRSGPTLSPPRLPSPMAWTRFLFAGFARKKIGRASALREHRPGGSSGQLISCWRGTSSPEKPGPRGRSAITRASTRPSMIIRCFHLTAITHRQDAIYPATIVGRSAHGRLLHRRRQRPRVPAGVPHEFSRRSSI